MTIDDLVKVFDKAWACLDEKSNAELYVSLDEMNRAGIRAVVEALRDEFGRIMEPSDDWNQKGIVDVFNEILGSDADKETP